MVDGRTVMMWYRTIVSLLSAEVAPDRGLLIGYRSGTWPFKCVVYMLLSRSSY